MGNNGTWDGARVVVTGGGRGIGRAVADGFASGGGRVIVADSDPAAAEGSDHAIVLADISSQTEVVALFEAVERRLGGLDVLVNNAGISGPAAPLQEIDPADWDRVIAVNLTGQFLCARAAIPLMLSGGGGSIVNIASTAGLFGYPDRSPYAASKFGVIGLTKTLAMELGTQGIRVNAVCPGTVSGPRMDRVIEAEAEATGRKAADIRAGYMAQTSMRTFIEATDIAATVLFLCSPASERVTGQVISVDGNTESLRT